MATRIDRDGALVAALRRGDPTGAEDLVTVYGDRAYRLATRITCDPQDAEEAVQDAFLSAIRKIDSFRGESAFGSWLYRIVANAAYQCCRRRRRRGADVSLDKLLPVFDEHGRHVAPVAGHWCEMIVDDPARQQSCSVWCSAPPSTNCPPTTALSWCCAMSRDSRTARSRGDLGLTVVNVKARVHRARLVLRKRLEAHLSIADVVSMPSVAAEPTVQG